jgi:hypothetical protein
MFPRTFDQRRAWTRCAFGLAAVLPTLLVLGMILWRAAAGERQALERRLSHDSGLQVTIGRVSHPRPRAVVLEGLALKDPESQADIVTIARLEARPRGSEWVLVADGVALSVEASRPLWDWLQRGLTRTLEERTWHLFTRHCVLRGAAGDQSLDDAHGVLQQGGRTSKLSLWANLPDTPAFEGLHASVSRDHEKRPPTLRWELFTRDRPFPCALLAPLADVTPWFGPDAEFQGSLWITQQGETYDAHVAGRVRHVDLNQLITTRFPHTLRGAPATLHIDEAHVQGGRLVKARGALSAGAGRVSRSLVTSAAEHLKLVPAPLDSRAELLSFERLALQFNLSRDQLELYAAGDAGIVLASSQGPPLLGTPRGGARVPPVGLLRALAPHSEHHVPATRETEVLARILPLPSVAPPRDAQGQPIPATARIIQAAPAIR